MERKARQGTQVRGNYVRYSSTSDNAFACKGIERNKSQLCMEASVPYLFIESECALRRDGSHGNQHYFSVDLHRVGVVNQIVAGLIQMIPCLLGQLLL